MDLLLALVLALIGVDKVKETRQVNNMIAQLGDDKFAKRHKADQWLRDNTRPAFAALRKAAVENEDLEIRVRARRIVAAYYRVKTSGEVMPSIEYLPNGLLRERYIKMAEKYYQDNFPEAGTWNRNYAGDWALFVRKGTEFMVRDFLEMGVPKDKVEKLLDKMNKWEVEGIKKKEEEAKKRQEEMNKRQEELRKKNNK